MTSEPPTDQVTESRNPASDRLDEMSAKEVVELMCDEDREVLAGVRAAAAQIATAIDRIVERLDRGGRLFYFGAGTSGRLGVLDASECPPTFSTDPGLVIGLIAGGDRALRHPIEGAEDRRDLGRDALVEHDFAADDVAVGITASGSAPYVLGAIEHARSVGALTVGISCNPGSALAAAVDVPISAVVGPEVLSGSTRLKAGTATKLVLNMLSTGAMVRLGKCYRNLMVDLQASNQKLRKRSVRIVAEASGLDEAASAALLDRSDGEVKTAIVAALLEVDVEVARDRLTKARGRVRAALA